MMLNKKLDSCPKCGGYAVVDMIREGCGCFEMDIRCLRCGLAMSYQSDAFEESPVRVTWSYYLDHNLSVFDVWNSYKEG